jgi:hypothetical protein
MFKADKVEFYKVEIWKLKLSNSQKNIFNKGDFHP